MDDIEALGGRFLGAHEPYPVETCRDSLAQLAALHAATWHDPQWDVEWLAPRVESMASFFPTDTLQELLDDGRGPELPAVLRDAAVLQAAMARTAEVPPTCVVHGDTHSGNAYVDAEGRVCWLDWQVTQRGHWSIDVSYHLGTVLDIETRRNHEADLSSTTSTSSGPTAWTRRRSTKRGSATRSASPGGTSCGSSPASAPEPSCSCTSLGSVRP